VELQPSDESRKEQLEAHAIFCNSLHLPLLPVTVPLLLYRNCTRQRKSHVANMYIAIQHILHTRQHILVVKTERRPLLENEECGERGAFWSPPSSFHRKEEIIAIFL
jgi:hypothetical protein